MALNTRVRQIATAIEAITANNTISRKAAKLSWPSIDGKANRELLKINQPPTGRHASWADGKPFRYTADHTNTITTSGGMLRKNSTYPVASLLSSQFDDSRAMPIRVPRISASGMPMMMIRIVLPKAAAIASATVSAGVIGLSAMLMPAG